MTVLGTAPDIPYLEKLKILIMITIRTGSGILNGTMMIPGAIMTKTIIEPDIPRQIKTKRSCLTSLGTVRDIKKTDRDAPRILECHDFSYGDGDSSRQSDQSPEKTKAQKKLGWTPKISYK